jgi:hypothetical protein
MTIEIIANCLIFIYFVKKNVTKKKFQLVRHYKNECITYTVKLNINFRCSHT